MSKTGNGIRASAQPRDTPLKSEKSLFDIILALQAEHYHLQGLARALACVVNELTETPVVSQHPGINATEALTEEITKALAGQLTTLETLEMARFGVREVA